MENLGLILIGIIIIYQGYALRKQHLKVRKDFEDLKKSSDKLKEKK